MAEAYPRVRWWAQGYDTAQVDRFVRGARRAWEADATPPAMTAGQIRTVGFDLRRGGYQVAAVDVSLDRVEEAFAARERGAGHGGVAPDGLAAQRRLVMERLKRPEGARFGRGHGFDPAYDVTQVDAFCARIAGRLAAGGGGDETLTASEVRGVVFRLRRGSRGYREPAVDAFLDRVVDLLSTQAVVPQR